MKVLSEKPIGYDRSCGGEGVRRERILMMSLRLMLLR